MLRHAYFDVPRDLRATYAHGNPKKLHSRQEKQEFRALFIWLLDHIHNVESANEYLLEEVVQLWPEET